VILLEIIPSIDLYRGKVVRFVRGKPETSHIYSDDPLKIAANWNQQGANAIHVVDLDSALDTGIENKDTILRIVDEISIPVQLGGGIRNYEIASSLLNRGVGCIVVGTLAFKDPSALKRMIRTFGADRIIIALDYIGEEIMVKGWTFSTGISIQKAITKFQNLNAELFLMTSVERDGTLIGPDYITLRKILNDFKIKILASGGIRSIHDLVHLKEIGVYGAVVGKALYEEKFNLKSALSSIRSM
jgi:phosphoribosylformimino-5-aminoimidazole carboxamide ribotide isomerase